MRQIAREKKKNKLFKTELGVSKRFLKGRSRKGKGEISSSFSNRCAFLLKRGRKSLIFSPRACIMEASAASGLKNRKSRRAGRALPPQKTENGENALRAGGRTRKCVVAVRRSGPSEQAMRERRQSGAWSADGWTGELCVRPLSRSRESGRD